VDCPANRSPRRGKETQYRFCLVGKRIPHRHGTHQSEASVTADEMLNRSAANAGMGNPQQHQITNGRIRAMKTIIKENQRGLLFQNGKFVAYLKPGKHIRLGRSFSVEVLHTGSEFKVQSYDLEVFLKNPELTSEVEVIDVADETLALHFVNGKYRETLVSGKYGFFKIHDKHEFRIVSIQTPEVADDVPKYLFTYMPRALYAKIEVADFQKARLCYDGKFIRLLEPGTYYFWNNGMKVTAGFVDTRSLQMDITGQEMMTLDKVALRINFVCNYKITDYVRIHTEIDDYEKQIHILLQLALREYVGKYRLDEILENKEQLSTAMLVRLKEKETEYFVTFSEAGVKDIILPGEIRSIMNTVLVAEKKAQANVITRREEVASTRSLLNTAKLMDENQTLYKLKELEYLEKICDNVGSISVTGGTDLLTQLTQILKGA
jgi:regulator of protease activity HflC (stomatin/prohibitin superfamily)